MIVNTSFCHEVRAILNDVTSIRDGQSSSELILGSLQVDNKSLWRDIAVLRNQNLKQRRVLEKLIPFLLSLIQTRSQQMVKKSRKSKSLMITASGSGSASCAADEPWQGAQEQPLSGDSSASSTPAGVSMELAELSPQVSGCELGGNLVAMPAQQLNGGANTEHRHSSAAAGAGLVSDPPQLVDSGGGANEPATMSGGGGGGSAVGSSGQLLQLGNGHVAGGGALFHSSPQQSNQSLRYVQQQYNGGLVHQQQHADACANFSATCSTPINSAGGQQRHSQSATSVINVATAATSVINVPQSAPRKASPAPPPPPPQATSSSASTGGGGGGNATSAAYQTLQFSGGGRQQDSRVDGMACQQQQQRHEHQQQQQQQHYTSQQQQQQQTLLHWSQQEFVNQNGYIGIMHTNDLFGHLQHRQDHR